MTRLVILAYGHGRLFHEYINAATDAEALAEAVRMARAENNEPREGLVLAGSAAIHADERGVDVWEIEK